MLPTTTNAVREILRADPSITPAVRARLLRTLRDGSDKPDAQPVAPEPRLLRRREVAARLSMSLRTVDKLAREGLLRKRVLAGRQRASGFVAESVDALVSGKGARDEAQG